MFPEGRALEFLIAAVVALVVVGPKDLPILMRRFGQFMAKLRGMAAEFRASFDEMARQSELDELRREVEAMRRGQFADPAANTHAEIRDTIQDIHQTLVNPDTPAVSPETPATPVMGLSSVEVSTVAGEAPLAPAPTSEAADAADAAPAPKRKPRARKKPAAGPAEDEPKTPPEPQA